MLGWQESTLKIHILELYVFFFLKSEVRTFSSECRYTDTYLSKVNFYGISLGFSQYEYN